MKKSKISKWVKVVAFILVIMTVAVTSFQLCGIGLTAIENDLESMTFSQAGLSLIGSEETKKKAINTVNAMAYREYVLELGRLITNYGDGTKQDYELLSVSAKEEGEKVYAYYKQNLISFLSRDYASMSYSDSLQAAEFSFTNDITLTDRLGSLEEGYSDDSIDGYYSALANYEIPMGVYKNKIIVPTEFKKELANKDYDGFLALPNIMDESGSVLIEQGYYAYKINDEILKNHLYKYGIFLNGFTADGRLTMSFEQFQNDYKAISAYINENYKNAFYFIRTAEGRVYTNTDFKHDTKAEELLKKASSNGFYVVENKNKLYLSEDGNRVSYFNLHPGGYFEESSLYGNYYSNVDYRYDITSDYYVETTVTTMGMPTGTEPLTTMTPTVPTAFETSVFEENGTTEIETTETSEEDGAVEASSIYTTNVETYETTRKVDYGNGSSLNSAPSAMGKTANTFVPLDGTTEFYIYVDTTYANGNDKFASATDNLKKTENLIKTSAVIIGICMILCLIFTIILCCATGRKKGDSQVYMVKTDAIFTDWRIIINGGLITGVGFLGLLAFAVEVFPANTLKFICILCCVIIAALLLDLITFIARHIKNKSFIKRIFVVWFIQKGYKLIKSKIKEKAAIFAENRSFLKSLSKSAFIKAVLFFAINGILAFFAFGFENFLLLILMAIGDIICFFFFMRYIYNLEIVLKNLELLRQGDYDVSINTYNMPVSVKNCANNIMNLRDGIKAAVDEAVKHEQTKTELITNVSHDLKTPLTSIINYVELLKKCNINDKDAKEYLDILGEKSDRLKKLIEDLVEASKASTGNIKVELIDVSLNEMINQLLGEHSANLDKKKLQVVCDMPVLDIIVRADSKLLYRVLENLIVNAEKYSLYGTRVYITLKYDGDMAYVSFKNISENPLNISAEELKERFVRGDEARSTEGNGLGLSIAESLCTIQGGRLDININGDLFTAKVSLNKSE